MKTMEMLKFNKVYYIMTRYNGRAQNRECFKKKTGNTPNEFRRSNRYTI